MSSIPENLKYTKDHEWTRAEGNRLVVGITDHAQRTLGDVVYVELPKVGTTVEMGEPFGTVESVKAVSELFMPVTGKVVKVNEEVVEDPELVNTDPYSDGWLIEIEPTDSKQVGELLDAAKYGELVKAE